ncbi:unnamed protein product [Paramecium primaurelia]|uniref:Uncharacterized protein n=1 Tax=Paramecium primaurelia TaxID=5886 RepID=A0A8S1KLB3_PARPR|nr:unnamed protein product [Paramecium primaurelia]
MKDSQSSSFVAVVLSVQALTVHVAAVDVPKQYLELLLPTIADSQNTKTPVQLAQVVSLAFGSTHPPFPLQTHPSKNELHVPSFQFSANLHVLILQQSFSVAVELLQHQLVVKLSIDPVLQANILLHVSQVPFIDVHGVVQSTQPFPLLIHPGKNEAHVALSVASVLSEHFLYIQGVVSVADDELVQQPGQLKQVDYVPESLLHSYLVIQVSILLLMHVDNSAAQLVSLLQQAPVKSEQDNSLQELFSQPHFLDTKIYNGFPFSSFLSKVLTLAQFAKQIDFFLNSLQFELLLQIGYHEQLLVPSQLYYLTVKSQVVYETHPDPVVTQFVKKLAQRGLVFKLVAAQVQSLATHLVPVFHVHLPSDPTLDQQLVASPSQFLQHILFLQQHIQFNIYYKHHQQLLYLELHRKPLVSKKLQLLYLFLYNIHQYRYIQHKLWHCQ